MGSRVRSRCSFLLSGVYHKFPVCEREVQIELATECDTKTKDGKLIKQTWQKQIENEMIGSGELSAKVLERGDEVEYTRNSRSVNENFN